MKKLIIVLAVGFISCKKTSNCYECSFGVMNGVKPNPQIYCGRNPEQHIFTDKDNNILQVIECKHE